jgi:protein-S-isoprenylcysteine O-methyltransferase Ste14
MPKYLASLAMVLLLGMVLIRAWVMRRRGVQAMKFAAIDRSDFLILPFALFYLYMVFTAALGSYGLGLRELFHAAVISWLGVLFCSAGLGLLFWSLASLSESFRIGIDRESPGRLATTGAFSLSRNPIYVAFAVILIGEFLVFRNWIFLLYIVAAAWLFHRQVLREEKYLRKRYGEEYAEYCKRVRRYL